MGGSERQVQAVLLIHGAHSGPWIFDAWPPFFPGVQVSAVDLQLGLRPETASMELYAGTVLAEAGRLPFPLVVSGYGMGGLVAMMAAQVLRPHLLVLIEPAPPAEVQGYHPEVHPVDGLYPAQADLASRVRLRPEALRARLERERGISIHSLPGPSVIVFGDEYAEGPGRAIARRYGAEELHFAERSHGQLVSDPRVPEAIARRIGLSPDASR